MIEQKLKENEIVKDIMNHLQKTYADVFSTSYITLRQISESKLATVLMNFDDSEGELECPICLIQLVEDSGIETVQSDIEGVIQMILEFSES